MKTFFKMARLVRRWLGVKGVALILLNLTAISGLSLAQETAATAPLGSQVLGGEHFENWKGVQISPDEHAAAISASAEAIFRYPDGPLGQIRHGYRTTNDGTGDWHEAMGVQLEIKLPDEQPVELKAAIGTPNDADESSMVQGKVTVQGMGWHVVTLPWSAFAFDHANILFLQTVKELRLSVKPPAGKVLMRNVRVVDGDPLALYCDIRGKSAAPGASVTYDVTVRNCALTSQTVALSFVKHGWESMPFTVEPVSFSLNPGESKACKVEVTVDERVAPGGHEEQVLQAIGDGSGDKATTLSFVTARALPHPYILHTPEAWQEIRDKVKQYPWAKTAQDKYIMEAGKWQVPEIAKPPGNDPNDNSGPFLFATLNEHGLMANAICWQLTGEKKYAEKVATFLRRLSDPQEGYPKTFRASNQGFVQEGHFFQHIAMSYDMVFDSGVLTADDQKQIEATFRLAMETFKLGNMGGAINNWNLSELCGAFYCSLAMQDLSAADYFFSCPSGIKNQMAKGVMDDGWWNECAVSYNTWCTSEFSQVAIAYAPWGVNFKDMWVPASFYKDSALSSPSGKAELNGGNTSSTAPRLNVNQLQNPFGMSKELWGPMTHPYREIRMMWNSLPPFIDYRGVMFGVNDSTERRPADQDEAYDIAYWLYRDPVYAAIVKYEKAPSLLYGVPDLPAQTPNVSGLSAYSDNSGLAMLRSQTPDRPQREQIQAVLHYGTHGWAHGHYDRTDLISLMRYGRSFYNPEMIWYGYEPYMYKFYVQTSMNHNMVVVDQKMQEPVESRRLLFYMGKKIQATVVESDARWSNPPYGGMVYDYVPVKTFAEKCWREGRDVPIPDKAPEYGTLTDYTEPVEQRRLLVVTDDYAVVADFLKAKEKHTFDNVLQLTGFQGLDAPEKNLLRHDGQWNPNPVSSAQFVTDCDWYSAKAPATGHFSMQWKADTDLKKTIAPTAFSEDGTLKMDVHSLWPLSQQIMVGQSPQVQGNEKKLWYNVKGDGKVLADGKFGSWILGKADVDVPLQGVKTLDLETKTEGAKKNTLFWANARVVTDEGKEIPLAKLPVKYENVAQPSLADKDYYGQTVKIVGTPFDAATPAEPQDEKVTGVVHVDLTGVKAVKFKAVLGGSYPLADGTQMHKVYAVRSEGTEARFTTLIEPFENQALVKSATATSADTMHVELTDGRVQDLTFHNFEGEGKDISVDIRETRNGQEIARESTSAATP